MTEPSRNGTTIKESSSPPKATILKKIVDSADKNPDTPIEELARHVPGATADLVENVLDEYGDPRLEADYQSDESATGVGRTSEESEPPSDAPAHGSTNDDVAPQTDQPDRHRGARTHQSFTEKELETLRAIYETPDATQATLANQYGVTSATINTRVNSIEGFDWESRHEFVSALFDGETDPAYPVRSDPPTTASFERAETFADRPEEHERRTDDPDNRAQALPLADNPELLEKVVLASLKSDYVTEEEELAILSDLL